jgi:hypothetical protein
MTHFHEDPVKRKNETTFERRRKFERALTGAVLETGVYVMSPILQNGDHQLVVGWSCRPLQRVDFNCATYFWRTRCNFKVA